MLASSTPSCAERRGCGERASLPPVLDGAPEDLSRFGHVATVRELPSGGRTGQGGDLLPASRPHLRAMPPGAVTGIHCSRRHFQRLLLLLVLQRFVGGPRG